MTPSMQGRLQDVALGKLNQNVLIITAKELQLPWTLNPLVTFRYSS